MNLTLLVAVAALLLWGIVIYNMLVASRNRSLNAFAQIDVQLKRRYDLIPKLVEVVKTYMTYEGETLDAVIRRRNTAVDSLGSASADPGNAAAIRQLGQSENALRKVLGQVFALVENYPDLKASQPMRQLNEEISTTENRIAFARQAYNDAVMRYNIRREMFPNSLIAGPFGFGAAQMLEFSTEEIRDPQVTLP